MRAKLLLTWLALPVYIWQGIGVRLRTERLLPPEGPKDGDISGNGEPIRLLVLGDSSAVGIGTQLTSENLASRLSHYLNGKSGRPVTWHTAGFNSATSGQIRDYAVPNLKREPWTHIALSVGTNDLKNFHSLSRFKREFGGLLYALTARFPDAGIYWSPPIDTRKVPALPQPMASLLEIRARAFSDLGTRLCKERGAVAIPRLEEIAAQGFSRDGFHAGPEGYDYWSEHLATHMLDHTS